MAETWVRVLASALVFSSILLLLGAAVSDLALRRVPNLVPALLATAGCVLDLLADALPEGIIAATIVFAAAFFCWRRGWMGGADVKLLAAAALLVSPRLVPELMLTIALAGGALGLFYLVLRRILPEARRCPPVHGRLARLLHRERVRIAEGELPYATAIAAGALVVLIT